MNKCKLFTRNLLAFSVVYFSGLTFAFETGDKCSDKIKLPVPLLCLDEKIVDCENVNTSREQLYCLDDALSSADKKLNRLYQRALKKLDQPDTIYEDYTAAKVALINAQRSWLRFRTSDCEIPMNLNLKGSAQSHQIIDCKLKRTNNRIEDLDDYQYRR